MNKNSFYPLGQLHHLKDACIEVKNGKEYWYTQKTLIECCNTIDEAIATAIIDIAKRNNFNDCLLLNEENILNLLRKAHYFDEELKRKEMIILQQKKRIDDLEKLISKVEKENKILSQNADTAFQDGLNEAQELYTEQIKTEVATKIFDDLERFGVYDNGMYHFIIGSFEYQTIKKKYIPEHPKGSEPSETESEVKTK